MSDRSLTTNWKRIGRSGATVDGRVIEPKMIEEAAANYNKDLFTALIWPEHQRWFNMGTVDAIKATDNDEGGKDLFALISPNSYYLEANKQGQKLFTSMELWPNFRKTGTWYLTGLGATDTPASVAISEIRLSNIAAKEGVFLSQIVEMTEREFTEPQKESFMSRLAAPFFKSKPDETDMADKAALEKLQQSIDALETKFASLKGIADDATKTPDAAVINAEAFAALVSKVAAIEAKHSEISMDNFSVRTTAIETELADLKEKLSNALSEQPGTQGGEHFGVESDKLADVY
jgi:hypothetical protein